MLRTEYAQWSYWEDFAHFVIAAGKPYTQREYQHVLQQWGQGMVETYGDGPEAMEGYEEVAKALKKAAKEHNNPPQDK